ncbi:MAG TPA: tetratricopeptide repeat protein, partial [Caulobacteraceae bacterium]
MDSAVADIAPPGRVEREVGRLRGLQKAGDHEQALQGAQALLAEYPQNRDLLLIGAVSLRHLGRLPESLAALDRLEGLHPKFSQAHLQRGLCHVAMKDAPGAIATLLRAVTLNPALPMGWRMLEGVYRLTGDTDNATRVAAQSAALSAQPAEVVTATSLFFDGDLAAAERIIRPFLLAHGDHPEAMRILAKIAVAHEALNDADALYEALLELAPDHRVARYEYGQVLVQRHRHAQALEQARRLLSLEPGNLDFRTLEASAVVGLGDHEAAIGLYRGILADSPDSSDLHLWLGHALKTVGRAPEA